MGSPDLFADESETPVILLNHYLSMVKFRGQKPESWV